MKNLSVKLFLLPRSIKYHTIIMISLFIWKIFFLAIYTSDTLKKKNDIVFLHFSSWIFFMFSMAMCFFINLSNIAFFTGRIPKRPYTRVTHPYSLLSNIQHISWNTIIKTNKRRKAMSCLPCMFNVMPENISIVEHWFKHLRALNRIEEDLYRGTLAATRWHRFFDAFNDSQGILKTYS